MTTLIDQAIADLTAAGYEVVDHFPHAITAKLRSGRYLAAVVLCDVTLGQFVALTRTEDDGALTELVADTDYRIGDGLEPLDIGHAITSAKALARVITEAAEAAKTMTVRVRNHAAESPWGSGPVSPIVSTVTISAHCPVCGGQRGEPRNSRQCDDGAYFSVDVWDNPCRHTDYYVSVLAEAAARAGAQR